MKKVMYLVFTALMLAVTPSAKAQFVVTDPANLASGILNSANEIVQTSSTVSNVVKNFKEVEKVYKQGKEYYDKLQAVNNLVKDARKVQQTVLLVGDVSEMYVTNFRSEERRVGKECGTRWTAVEEKKKRQGLRRGDE